MDYLQIQDIRLPRLGLGTYRMQGDICRKAVEGALALGYRHIDTAEIYENEDAVGAAITMSGLARDALHVTTKVSHHNLAPDAIRRSFDASLRKLKLDYVDLYLVHWPTPSMDLSLIFETLMALKAQGRARAIGVANFTLPLLKTVVEEIGAPIVCNQIEYHVLLDQTPIRNYLASHAISLVAYRPLAQGRIADYPAMTEIARKYDVTPAQVALKWLLDQDGVAAIPKAEQPKRQRENLEALHITLDDDDRRVIARLPKDQRFTNPRFAPIWDAPVAGSTG